MTDPLQLGVADVTTMDRFLRAGSILGFIRLGRPPFSFNLSNQSPVLNLATLPPSI
jgi:hypothetical protein